jgi:hypothetical protein
MKSDNLNPNGYNINFEICSEKKINWIHENIPKIKEDVYSLKFDRENDILNICYTKIFFNPDIYSFLENNFMEFEFKLSYLIKAIERFIYD